MPKNDLLFGKPLQSLVEKALTNLNNSNVETVIVSDIITQIFQDKPDLLVLLKNTQQKKNHKYCAPVRQHDYQLAQCRRNRGY